MASRTHESERIRRWLEGLSRATQNDRRQAEAAIDAYDRIVASSKCTGADLDTIREAASSPKKVVWETGSQLLHALSGRFSEAHEVYMVMLQSDRASTRHHAVSFLTSSLPRPLRMDAIIKGLADNDPKVRSRSAEKAEEFGLRELVDALSKSLAVETNEAAKLSTRIALHLLRDGYFLEKTEDGGGWLTTRKGNSLSSEFLCPEDATEDKLRKLRNQAGSKRQ